MKLSPLLVERGMMSAAEFERVTGYTPWPPGPQTVFEYSLEFLSRWRPRLVVEPRRGR
jgi:hypothetical protein